MRNSVPPPLTEFRGIAIGMAISLVMWVGIIVLLSRVGTWLGLR